MISTIKSYSELLKIDSLEGRIRYLQTDSKVGDITFGGNRQVNQILYHSYEWKKIRERVIIRDNGCDLAFPEFPINGFAFIHHINPVTIEDIVDQRSCVFDLENLITCCKQTHDQIHYGCSEIIDQFPYPIKGFANRTKNDTIPWR